MVHFDWAPGLGGRPNLMARRKKNPNGTRENILQAADELFGESGFDAASTRLIAERSGVNKALIHYHFSSKQALFEAVLDRYYERLQAALPPLLAEEGTIRDRMLGVIDGYMDFLADNTSFCRLLQREVVGEQHLARILAHMVPLFQAGELVLHRAYPKSASGALAARELLLSFFGMIVSTYTYSPAIAGLIADDPLSPENLGKRKQHIRFMAELIFRELEEG